MMAQIQKMAGVTILSLGLWAVSLGLTGCSESAAPVTSPAAGKVNTYFSGPFNVAGSSVGRSSTSFDHAAGQVAVSGFVTNNQSILVPTQTLSGSFTSASTGFLAVSENFITTTTGHLIPQNPPLSGAWAVEIPGAGALGNFLNVNSTSNPPTITAAPAVMADNTACPYFPSQSTFLYVNVPNPSAVSPSDTSNYGIVAITTQGSAVTFNATPFLVGPLAGTQSTLTGACSVSTLGALTAYPLNSYGQASNVELVSIGKSGLLVSSFTSAGNVSSIGAFGGGNGVIGVQQPSSPVDPGSLIAAKYNGFMYSPKNRVVGGTYDITQLASAFGNHAGTDPVCSALQSSLAANHGQGANTVPILPSPNTIFGGEFLVDGPSGRVNDPSGQLGSENCDVAIDLGNEDSNNAGIFPNATIFIGSNYPPFSTTNPWNCFGTSSPCAVSFPAAAVVGQVQNQFVILVVATPNSNPPAQLPDSFNSLVNQPFEIYLFQNSQ